MKKTIILAVVLVVAVLVYIAYKPTPKPEPLNPVSPTLSTTPTPLAVRAATPAEIKDLVTANNQFAFDLYSRYKTTQAGKNIFYSPYSITTALGMTYEGASGQTAAEMQKVFHMPANAGARRAASASVIDSLNTASSLFTLKTANALWAEKTFAFLPDFLSITKTYYKGNTTNLDFIGNAEGSRKTINTWVANQTSNKITDLIPSGAVDRMTRMVLTNAIYFKGTWVIEFDKSKTQAADFTLVSGSKTSAPLMALSGPKAIFKYAEDQNDQAIELPYKGDRLSMLVILPKNSGLQSVEGSLNVDTVANLEKSLILERVDIFLPKFTFKTTYQMADDLRALGMPTAFSGSADFSGMDGKKDLNISQVIHQAFVDVNEEGTEAAAATAVIVSTSSVMPAPIPVFRADHPFVFMIRDNQTGEILFMGRVMDPTAK